MPINAYVGWPGAGKSYQVVSNVIIPQIAKGRSIVTNIDGIDLDAVYENIFCNNRGKIVCLGTVRKITNEEVESPLLFPRQFTDTEWKKYKTTKSWQSFLAFRKDCGLTTKDEFVSIVNPGEMVIIDEAVNWWGQECAIIPEHSKFFREHRHHVDPYTHESCDLVLIAQEISDLKRSLRALVQYTFRAEKLDVVGLDKRFKLHMYRGAKLGDRVPALRSELGQYKPEIYECYDSYGGGKGKEKSIDSRHNILSDKKLKFKAIAMLTAMVVLSIFAYSLIKGYFSASSHTKVDKASVNSVPLEQAKNVPVSNVPFGSSGVNSLNNKLDKEKKVLGSSAGWRIVGRFTKKGFPVFVLQDGDGGVTYYSPVLAVQSQNQMRFTVDGADLSSWTGSVSKGRLK